MDNLRNQMAALVQGIATSAHERERVIDDIKGKGQTANMLRAFGRERTAMAKVLKAGLAADVLAIRDNTSTMCEGFRQDHVRMQRSLRQSLDQSRETVVTTVASLRVDFAKVHRHMAKAQRAELTKDSRYRSHAVAELMSAFAKAHRHMAKVQRAGLAKGRRDRSRAVTELMKDFHVSRGKMAQELTESLAKSRQETKAQVSGLNGSWASLQKIHKDAWPLRQIPNGLLAGQPAEEFSAPISAPVLDPENGETEESQEKKAIGEAVRHLGGKPGKPKKK